MSTEDTCVSRAYRNDQLATCTRELGHDGVHLGRVLATDDGGTSTTEELVQWTDADAISDTDSVDDLPIWYSALPIGATVVVAYREHPRAEVARGTLTGCVLDDHEQPAALVFVDDELGIRVLVPWSNVAEIAHEVEQ